MSPSDLKEQNSSIDNKLVAGLERLSRVFRSLLWDAAYLHQLSPTQLQILIFIHAHSAAQANTRYLAAEFGVSMPTISDAVGRLVTKGFLTKTKLSTDARKHELSLTVAGKRIARNAAPYLHPVRNSFAGYDETGKLRFWEMLLNIISGMNTAGLIHADRSCYSCASFELREDGPHCKFIGEKLKTADLRIDCPEHREDGRDVIGNG